MEKGYSIRIYLPNGDPEGLRIIEKANWTGKGIVFPRALFNEAKQRAELKHTGVYILWGPAETGELPQVYVGEGDPVLPRIEQHIKVKEFWTHCGVFTSKDQNLNKAYVQHLESHLIRMATKARRCELDNGNRPLPPSLAEADEADAGRFLEDILLCLPLVGVNVFEQAKTMKKTNDLFIKTKGIEARGTDSPQGFLVFEGSTMIKTEAPGTPAWVIDLRRSLVKNGLFKLAGENYRLTEDYLFASPSKAACVLFGHLANGYLEWKDLKGRPLKEIQSAGAESE